MNDIRTVELFAGIGGFRLGLERANNTAHKQISEVNPSQDSSSIEKRSKPQLSSSFKIVWANEWDKYACQIYRKNFGEKELYEGDIRKVKTDDIPECDLIVGGFPCQPHSLAGKRKGFGDERGTVFHEIVRIARAKRPEMLLLENVKGLLSSEQGRAFGTVLEELGSIGYWCEWQVINSKHHGVPQNRERVFIIGHLRGASSKQVFPIGSNDAEAYDEGQFVGTLTGGGHSGGLHSDMTGIISNTVRSGGRGSLDRHSWDLVQINDDGGSQVDRVYDPCGLSHTVPTASGGRHIPKIAQALQTDGFLRSGSSFGTNKPQSSRNVRRLTEVECERLQGFPDNFTEGISGTQRYKCLGNAVTVNVIQFLGERILASFDDKTKTEAILP